MKIMHLLAPAPAGGLERVVHALSIGQHRRGHHVTVAPIADTFSADHSFAVPLLREQIDVRPIVVPARAYRRERAAIRGLLAEVKPDVVHGHGYHANVVNGDIVRRAGIATVATAHGFTRGPWRNRFYEWLECRAFRHFDAVAAVSAPLVEHLAGSGVPGSHIHLVPNGWSRVGAPIPRLEARRKLGLPPEAFVIGWVGRMSFEKGLDVVVDAVQLLRDVPITVVAIGDGPERAAQEARSLALDLQDRMRWPGMILEAGRYFQALDGLVLSSRTEGVPMVILEAMASSIPLVTTSVGGIPNVVSPREALMVPPEQPAALATAIRSLFFDRTAAAERARAARARIEAEFAEDRWLDRYDRVYDEARRHAKARRTK
jgi:glycosyltransferase involved in cell wall biosynthesis